MKDKLFPQERVSYHCHIKDLLWKQREDTAATSDWQPSFLINCLNEARAFTPSK